MGELLSERYCCNKWKLKRLTIYVDGRWLML